MPESNPYSPILPPPQPSIWPATSEAEILQAVETRLTYTPIVIQFLSPILNEDSSPYTDKQGKKRYALRISCPPSNRPGEWQYIPDSYYYEIPDDGLLRLQLVPSDRYLPIGRYVVEYFRIGKKLPVLTQRWVVPKPPPIGTYSFSYELQPPILPVDVWKITSVSAGHEWVGLYNSLTWGTPPALGEVVNVRYQRAVTLDKLIDYSLNSNSIKETDRIRY